MARTLHGSAHRASAPLPSCRAASLIAPPLLLMGGLGRPIANLGFRV